ncbi:hypothetical protein NW767_009253 [Fusarium falciforme]|nr:hypothetical protein NW767_009253 [Fusarium falciforme]
MSDPRQEEFDATHAYFIGPKGSNLPDFRANINTILDELLVARQSYYPEDRAFIPKEVRRSEKFLKARTNLRLATEKVAQLLGEHSAPFWSPRYEAHMCTDLTMSSLLGYFMTMLYNPNNVALEASPMTTLVELRVGQQLCKLFGYNIDEFKSPLAWGHITCGGTVANLESIWVARNLKFYPLSLQLALGAKGAEGKLKFIAKEFYAPSSHPAPRKLFTDLSTWELLNLRPDVILDLPKELEKQFGITSQFLESALNEFNIQTVGREYLEKKFEIEEPAKYFVSKTRHYSWPKGAAIAGLGSKNMIGVDINNGAQIDIAKLRSHLDKCVKDEIPVYAVVAVIGSTEEGSVDSLTEILELRREFQEKHGLSFLVHADAAWGGYFATMVNRETHCRTPDEGSTIKKPEPEWYLDPKTAADLRAMENADSVTVDPHKAGYIPYPAGSLCYKDGRMRHLVTWSGPYLSQGSAENIGVYGVEGSKPGAAAMSAWFSNTTIGLNPHGYGRLLGEAAFTSARLSAHWATMENDFFMCVPFNMLPAEKGGDRSFFSAPVTNQRQKIKDLIVDKSDEQIFNSPEAMKLIRDLGSDLNINAFTLNWKYGDDKKTLNTDLEEANYFMKRIVDRLSITTADTDPTKIPIFLTSTSFLHDDYGDCAKTFMKRMGLQECDQSLFVLRNVVMSPFPTQNNFLKSLMKELEDVIVDEAKACRKRNTPREKQIQFLVQGSPTASEVFLVFKASFHGISRRQQVILSATLDGNLKESYEKLLNDGRDIPVMLETDDKFFIEDVVQKIGTSDVEGVSVRMFEKGTRKYNPMQGTVSFKSVVKSRPLNSPYRDPDYPSEFMPFYLYGTEKEMHITHVLVKSPNICLSAGNVKFESSLDPSVSRLLGEGLILGLTEKPENSMQPFATKNKNLGDKFFFSPNKEFAVKIWKDPKGTSAAGPGLLSGLGEPIYDGLMTLGENVFVDVEGPNEDKHYEKKPVSDSWQKKLDEIGSMLDGTHVHNH